VDGEPNRTAVDHLWKLIPDKDGRLHLVTPGNSPIPLDDLMIAYLARPALIEALQRAEQSLRDHGQVLRYARAARHRRIGEALLLAADLSLNTLMTHSSTAAPSAARSEGG